MVVRHLNAPRILVLSAALAAALAAICAGSLFGADARGILGMLNVTARVSKVDDKTRTIQAITWVRMTSPNAPGTLPPELVEIIARFRARSAEIRKQAKSLQELRYATRYESVASELELYREHEIQFTFLHNTRITKPTRDSLSMIGLGETLIATGIGSNFNSKNEPTIIELTKDVVEVNPDSPVGTGDGNTFGFTPFGGAPSLVPVPMVTSVAGRVTGLRPLSIQTLKGTYIMLIQRPASDIGFQHDIPISFRELKSGDRIEVASQRTGKGGLAAMTVRIMPPKPVGGMMLDIP